MSASFPRCCLTLVFATFLTSARAAETARVDFQREIRPILSDSCFHCHGPDAESRMAGMRLDMREGAFGQRDNGTPIVPGDPAKSLLYQRISAADPARRMPPQYAHKELKPEQIALIKTWIEQGASWSEHWAFVAPKKADPPAVKNTAWVRNPIDRFILPRLEAEGLTPAPEADRRTLIRRVSLDLTGLPPEPEQVEAFVADTAPDAYEKLVDKLLDSPAYGEHRARYWLDAARYGDTHGLHIDNYREIWPYRDWVIKAFNRNEPFDQFTIEQVAGDLLPNPTRDQLVATGFHRCNITTNEGGVIEEEVAAIYAKDRVDTTGAVWMGLTIGCATCHDHKFDPIKQRDFYSMAAFFRNTTQKPLDGNIFDTPPSIIVPSDTDSPRWDALDREIPAAEAKLEQARSEARQKVERWLTSHNRHLEKELRTPDQGEIFRLSADRKPALPEGVAVKDVDGTASLEFDEEGALEIQEAPPIQADKPFTIAARFRLEKQEGSHVIASQYDPDDHGRGWRLEINGGRPMLVLTADENHESIVRSTGDDKAGAGKWHSVVASYDGFRQRVGMRLYLDGKLLPVESLGTVIRTLESEIQSSKPLVIGARANDDNKKAGYLNGSLADLRILSRTLNEPEVRLLSLWDAVESAATKDAKDLNERERDALTAYFLVRRDRPYQKATKDLASLQDEKHAIVRRSPITLVMQERKDSKPVAHVLNRGMYDQPREEVGPGTPGVLPPMADSLPRNRLGLAKWLVDDANPLTARVTVNRFWQEVFGAGIVRTAEDFGSQGEPPTHPELLDWLAVDFRESGWDVKRLFKLMVTSATYRQSAATTPQKLESDPEQPAALARPASSAWMPR